MEDALYCRFSSGIVVKRLFEALRDFTKTVNLDVDGEGWTIKSFDDSNVATVCMKLTTEAFARYECTKAMRISLSVGHMIKVLRLCDPADALLLHYKYPDDKILIRIEKEASSRVVEFVVGLVEEKLVTSELEHREKPDLSQEFIEMPSTEYSRITKDLQNFGNDLEIKATPTLVTFTSEGDQGMGCINLKNMAETTSVPGVKINLSKTFHQKFALRYLAIFSKASVCNTYVTLHFSDEHPLTVRFPLDDKMRAASATEKKKADVKDEHGGDKNKAPPKQEFMLRQGTGVLEFELNHKLAN